jgi:hypothetical protein
MAIDIGGFVFLVGHINHIRKEGMHQKHGDLAVESRVRLGVFDATNFTFQWKGKLSNTNVNVANQGKNWRMAITTIPYEQRHYFCEMHVLYSMVRMVYQYWRHGQQTMQ